MNLRVLRSFDCICTAVEYFIIQDARTENYELIMNLNAEFRRGRCLIKLFCHIINNSYLHILAAHGKESSLHRLDGCAEGKTNE